MSCCSSVSRTSIGVLPYCGQRHDADSMNRYGALAILLEHRKIRNRRSPDQVGPRPFPHAVSGAGAARPRTAHSLFGRARRVEPAEITTLEAWAYNSAWQNTILHNKTSGTFFNVLRSAVGVPVSIIHNTFRVVVLVYLHVLRCSRHCVCSQNGIAAHCTCLERHSHKGGSITREAAAEAG